MYIFLCVNLYKLNILMELNQPSFYNEINSPQELILHAGTRCVKYSTHTEVLYYTHTEVLYNRLKF